MIYREDHQTDKTNKTTRQTETKRLQDRQTNNIIKSPTAPLHSVNHVLKSNLLKNLYVSWSADDTSALRTGNRSAVTRLLRKFADAKESSEFDREELLATYENLQQKKKLLDTLNEQIENASETEDIETEISIKAKTDLLNDKVKEINDTLASTQEKSASFSQSITDIRKRLSKAEKEVNCLDKTSKSYANILTTKMDHMDNISTVDSSYCSSELALPDMHRTVNITNQYRT
ncbi:unnamed protein product [Mytilus edulis]|uniref:Uncharacterized protein n=1 Tax=Mytilus edulis TaxID=6550 RepID=A0A8S3SVS9_MYTED|nr:unnamed protein product [Mytilus edulis]